MDKDIFAIKRKSYLEIGEIFFWTATINNWQRLLMKDEYKNIIINSLNYLSDLGKIDVFGFVNLRHRKKDYYPYLFSIIF